MNPVFCPWEPAQYLIFSSNIPTLLYYSHLVAVLAAALFGTVLLVKARHSLAIKVFIANIGFFIIWAVLDVLLWASNDPGVVLFYWGLQILLEMLLYAGMFYFAHVIATGKDLRLFWKVLLGAMISPIIVLLPTSRLLPAIDVAYCNAVESNFVVVFSYAVEIFLTFLILFVVFREMENTKSRRRELMTFVLGVIVFLVSFSSGNIIGSITENWSLAQIGLFGMPVFIAFLAYTVVKFKAFNMKLLSAQVFVVTLWFLTLSALFVRTLQNIRYITFGNLILATILGYILVRGVKREVAQREEIEDLARRLKNVNSILGHDVKAVLGKNKDMFNALIEGDLGTVPDDSKPFLKQSFQDTQVLIESITTILESGHELVLNPAPFDLRESVTRLVEEARRDAEAKGLALKAIIADGDYTINADKVQLETHVLRNLINNALNYTPKGSVEVYLSKESDGTFQFRIKDTGIGINDEDKDVLFKEGGHGKDSRKVNIHSTGYGLFIAKKIVDAHGGKIWAESDGPGKGSTFFVTLTSLSTTGEQNKKPLTS